MRTTICIFGVVKHIFVFFAGLCIICKKQQGFLRVWSLSYYNGYKYKTACEENKWNKNVLYNYYLKCMHSLLLSMFLVMFDFSIVTTCLFEMLDFFVVFVIVLLYVAPWLSQWLNTYKRRTAFGLVRNSEVYMSDILLELLFKCHVKTYAFWL